MNFVKSKKYLFNDNTDSINTELTEKGEIPNSPKGSIKLFALQNTSEGIKIKCTYDNNFEEEIKFDNFISLINSSISAKNYLYHRVSKKNFTFAFSESRDLNSSVEISTPKSTILNEDVVQISNNNYCFFHNEKMISYCHDCQMNVCEKCNNHNNHDLIKMEDLFLSNEKIDKLNKTINQAELTIERFVEKTKEKIKCLEKSLENFREMNLKEISLTRELLKLYEMKKQKNELNFHYIYNIENFIKFNFPFQLPEEKIPITDLITYLNDCHNYILKETQIDLKENFQEQRRIINYYPIKSMTILKDGRVACSNNNQIKIFDKNDFDYFTCITTESLINCFIQLKDERLIVGMENNNMCLIKLFENGEFKIEQIIKGHNYSVLCIQELTNGEICSSSKEGELKFWYKKIIKPYKKKKERVLIRNATSSNFKRKFIQEKKIVKRIKGRVDKRNDKKNNKLYMTVSKKMNYFNKIEGKKDKKDKKNDKDKKDVKIKENENDIKDDDNKINVIFERKKIIKKNDIKKEEKKEEKNEEKKEEIKEEKKEEFKEEKKEEFKEEKKEEFKEEKKEELEDKKDELKEDNQIIKKDDLKEFDFDDEPLNINFEIQKKESQEQNLQNVLFQLETPRREKIQYSTIENQISTPLSLSFTEDLKQDLLKENVIYKKHAVDINKSAVNINNTESQIEYPMLHTRETITIDLNKTTDEDLNKTQVIYHRPTIKDNNTNTSNLSNNNTTNNSIMNNTENKIYSQKHNKKIFGNINEFDISKDKINNTFYKGYNTNNSFFSLLNSPSVDQIPEIKTVVIPMSIIAPTEDNDNDNENERDKEKEKVKFSEKIKEKVIFRKKFDIIYKDNDYMLITSFDQLNLSIFHQINKNEIVGTSFKNQSVIIINLFKKEIVQEFKDIKCSFNNQSICVIDENQFLIGCENYINLFKNEINGFKSIHKIETDIDWIHSIFKLKDLKNIYLIGDSCGNLREVELNNNKCKVLKKKDNHRKEINCICVNNENKIITGGEDQLVIIWK